MLLAEKLNDRFIAYSRKLTLKSLIIVFDENRQSWAISHTFSLYALEKRKH